MLPTDLAAALRRELDGCDGLRVGLEAVADSILLAHPSDHCGPRPGVWPPGLIWDGGVLQCGSPRRERCCAPTLLFACPLRVNDLRLPCGHGIASDDPRLEERAPEVLRGTARQVGVRERVLLRKTLQGALQDAEGGHEVPAGTRGRGGAVRRSEPSVYPGRRAVGRAEESLQLVVAELPREIPHLDHMLE